MKDIIYKGYRMRKLSYKRLFHIKGIVYKAYHI